MRILIPILYLYSTNTHTNTYLSTKAQTRHHSPSHGRCPETPPRVGASAASSPSKLRLQSRSPQPCPRSQIPTGTTASGRAATSSSRRPPPPMASPFSGNVAENLASRVVREAARMTVSPRDGRAAMDDGAAYSPSRSAMRPQDEDRRDGMERYVAWLLGVVAFGVRVSQCACLCEPRTADNPSPPSSDRSDPTHRAGGNYDHLPFA